MDENPTPELTIFPRSAYSTDNIQIRCHIPKPSIYDNIYLFVKTDNVKPSGILLMADSTNGECRINENKGKYIQVTACNASLIEITVNHEVINDSLHTIEYACNQGDVSADSSFRILSKKFKLTESIFYFDWLDLEEQTARYYDQKSSNSSATLTHTIFLLLLFALRTITAVR